MKDTETPYEHTPEFALGMKEERVEELRNEAIEAIKSHTMYSDAYKQLIEYTDDPLELFLLGKFTQQTRDKLTSLMGLFERIGMGDEE